MLNRRVTPGVEEQLEKIQIQTIVHRSDQEEQPANVKITIAAASAHLDGDRSRTSGR